MKVQRIIIIFLIYFQYITAHHSRCGSDSIKKEPHKIKDDTINNTRRGLKSEYTPLKLYIDYTYLESQKKLNSKNLNDLKYLFSEVKQAINTLLSIEHISIQVDGPLISDYCDIPKYSYNIGSALYTNDILIFPTINSNLDDYVLAQAWTCITLSSNNRPVAGVVEINPHFSLDKHDTAYYMKFLLLHELSHVLGFSSSFFSALGLLKTEKINGVTKNYISSPKVLQKAQIHFNCKNIKGVELENQGGEGSAGSHWEARYMLGDYMISTDYPENTISDITLAYFEDTGFYKVNYYTGGLFRFGKNKGCAFLEEDCVYNNGQNTSFPNEFCTEPESFFCGSSHLSRGECYIVEYEKRIESKFRHYQNYYKGGFSAADYCPVSYNYYYREFENEYNYPFNCNYGANINTDIGEVIGGNSLCFESSLIPKSYNKQLNDIYSVCYKIECDRNNRQIKVYILGVTVTCPGHETVLNQPNGFNGQIKCPDYNLVCTSEVWCNELFDCIKKNSKAARDTYYSDVIEFTAKDDSDNYLNYGFNYYIMIFTIISLLVF